MQYAARGFVLLIIVILAFYYHVSDYIGAIYGYAAAHFGEMFGKSIFIPR